MSKAKIFKVDGDYIVDIDGTIFRGKKIQMNRLPDGRMSIRIYDPAFSWTPRSRARMYHNDNTVIADEIEDNR